MPTKEKKILPRCEFGFWSVRTWGDKYKTTTLVRDSKKTFCQGWLMGRADAEIEAALKGETICREYWLLLCKPSGEVVWEHSLQPCIKHSMLAARIEGNTVVVSLNLQSDPSSEIFEGRASALLSIPDALRQAAIEAIRTQKNPPEELSDEIEVK